MKTIGLFLALIGLTYSQQETCEYHGGPNGRYLLNLTSISKWRLEYKDPNNHYYYSPCRNAEGCYQGSATFYGNAVQYMEGNQCRHYLSVDHHERPTYFFGGASWAFQYNDGEKCDMTQEPRQTNIWYQCDEILNSDAWMYDVDEPQTCRYNIVIRSPLACVPENSHNANCQWKWTDYNSNTSYYLDLSSQNGSVIRDRETDNGYQHYYTPCQNGMHCYQQTGGEIKVMSLVENDITHTCEHYLAIWQEGRVQPIFHQHDDEKETHWSFHFWLSEKCTNGLQGEETIRWYCDPDVANHTLINATYDGDCRWEMNIKSSLACPQNQIYHTHNGINLKELQYKLKY